MKLKSMTMGEDEMPQTIVVEMTIAEAAAIARLFGKLNGHGQSKLGGYEAVEEIYDCLTGAVFNRFWDAGVDEVLRGKIDLATLNDEPKELL